MPINEIESIITPDGRELVFGDPQVRVVTSIGGRGAPPVEYQTIRGYNQQSETVLSYLLQPRTISMKFSWNLTTRAQFWAARRELIDSLRVNLGGALILKHTRADGTVRCIQAYPDSTPVIENDLADGWESWEETLSFICYDPTFYNHIPVIKTYTTALAGFLVFPATFPIKFADDLKVGEETITYNGNFASWPLITVNGPYSDVVVENRTTGKMVKLGSPILAGEQRIIDLTPSATSIVDTNGVSRFNELILPDSDLLGMNIRPAGNPLGADNPYGGVSGGINQIRIAATDSVAGQTSATLVFYERFVSID
jgi:hypothetical protein